VTVQHQDSLASITKLISVRLKNESEISIGVRIRKTLAIHQSQNKQCRSIIIKRSRTCWIEENYYNQLGVMYYYKDIIEIDRRAEA
jgi:hypothetical protein